MPASAHEPGLALAVVVASGAAVFRYRRTGTRWPLGLTAAGAGLLLTAHFLEHEAVELIGVLGLLLGAVLGRRAVREPGLAPETAT